jgi:hypothetical protein
VSTQTLLDPADASPPRPPHLLLHSSAAALVLVLAVAFIGWHHPNGVRVASVSDAAAAPVPDGGASPPLTVFPVASEGQRAAVQADVESATNPLRLHEGPQSALVLDTTTAHGAQATWTLVNDARTARGEGQPAVVLIDLRTPATGTRGTCGTSVAPAEC